jgi:uncharacterized protein YjaZ
MSVINTIEWLKDTPNQIDICKKLSTYFTDSNETEIAKYLHSFGMFKGKQKLDKWIDIQEKEKIFSFVREEEKKLRMEWNGPNVPIFIFPCDQNNRKIETEYKGRSGLAFKDKLFLFLSLETLKIDIRSLFTHEYHHVCRLAALKKQEAKFTIIDTIILEGLAENAVREKMGVRNVSSWTNFYSDNQCERFLERIIIPQRDVTRENHKFTQLMFGTGLYPKMLGYAVGYYLVKNYMEQSGKTAKELLGTPAEVFFSPSKQ